MKLTAKYCLYFVLGGIALSLGVIGVFLPILPTTPFLLLSSYCFLRSSKRAHDWLMNHPVLGTYLRNYIENKAIRKKDRFYVLVLLWTTLIVSMVLTDVIHLRYFLLLVGIGVSIHLMMLKVVD